MDSISIVMFFFFRAKLLAQVVVTTHPRMSSPKERAIKVCFLDNIYGKPKLVKSSLTKAGES